MALPSFAGLVNSARHPCVQKTIHDNKFGEVHRFSKNRLQLVVNGGGVSWCVVWQTTLLLGAEGKHYLQQVLLCRGCYSCSIRFPHDARQPSIDFVGITKMTLFNSNHPHKLHTSRVSLLSKTSAITTLVAAQQPSTSIGRPNETLTEHSYNQSSWGQCQYFKQTCRRTLATGEQRKASTFLSSLVFPEPNNCTAGESLVMSFSSSQRSQLPRSPKVPLHVQS